MRLADEEVSVRNLSGELSVMESALNLERNKADRLQEDMDDNRRRYEQRLSLVMANPNIRNQGTRTVDVASKVEIQRLKQELVEAQNALVVPYQPPNPNVEEQEQLIVEMKAIKNENDEMKEQGAFNFWRKKCDEFKNEKMEADQLLREARRIAREEKEMHEEEYAQRRGEDTDRLRRERNEWREYYDELIAGWTEEDNAEEEHEMRSTVSETAV